MSLNPPDYDPKTHYLRVADSEYFHYISELRHKIHIATDEYWSSKQNATSIDLFMLTPSISSPMGPSSDSEAIPIHFGGLDTFLVDSAQFGLEPLLLNGFEKVYCYLPSLRGEDFDNRHLNQFYHCEAEINGSLEELIPLIDEYVKHLLKMLLENDKLISLLSANYEVTKKAIYDSLAQQDFPRISFDDAVNLLEDNGKGNLIVYSDSGRSFSTSAEIELAVILDHKAPFWVYGYDRDTVPFYQKPDPKNSERVLNADLIFPPILKNAFGGEGVGCGQRQDSEPEMFTSLKRQGISGEAYEWYIHMRTLPQYKTTSGFGLGIERFMAWILGRDNIRDMILYPRLKGIKTLP